MIAVRRADLSLAADRAALVRLLDGYARDPMGGGTPLAPEVAARLCDDLRRLPHAVSFIATVDDADVGLLNAFLGYSTFKARPLLNVHDICVQPGHRGRGIGQALLAAAQAHAQAQDCCKLTLEVLSGNTVALRSYQRFGFAGFQLDPAAGHALMMQKWL